MFILTATLSFADDEICTKKLKNCIGFELVCLNGDEYLVFNGSRAGGVEKTGKSCECKKTTGMFGIEALVFKSVKDY